MSNDGDWEEQMSGKSLRSGDDIIGWSDDKTTPIYKEEPIHTSTIEDLDNLPTIGEENVVDTRQQSCNSSNNNNTNDNKSNNSNNIISIEDYKFEKPNFECELLKVVVDDDNSIEIIGYIKSVGQFLALSWNVKDGYAFVEWYRNKNYDLTPIKPKWYDNESNFPALIYTSEGFYVAKKKMEASYVFNGTDRLATKEELNSLYYEGK